MGWRDRIGESFRLIGLNAKSTLAVDFVFPFHTLFRESLAMRTLCNTPRLFPVTLLFTTCLLTGSGCGGGTEKVVAVTGKVTRNGNPVPGITVSFVPQRETETGVSSGTTDKNGQYYLTVAKTGGRGAVVGTHKVWVSIPRTPEQAPKKEDFGKKKGALSTPAAEMPEDTAEMLQKFGNLDKTPLTKEVKGGETIDLQLD